MYYCFLCISCLHLFTVINVLRLWHGTMIYILLRLPCLYVMKYRIGYTVTEVSLLYSLKCSMIPLQ